MLFITHDRYFLDNVATRIFELANSQLTEYQGNYQDYVRLRAEQDERDAATLHRKTTLQARIGLDAYTNTSACDKTSRNKYQSFQ